jgi:hypothetical protein
MEMAMTLPGYTPAWFNQLPPLSRLAGRHAVMIDNQVLSYRVLDARSDPVLDFLFEDERIVLLIGRQVIDETLHSVGVDDTGIELDRRGRPQQVGPVVLRPGLPAALNQRMWEGVAALQARGKLVLAGLSQMTTEQRARYNVLAPMIEAASGRNMGEKDARVAADGLVRQVPIYTLDQRFRDAFQRAMLSAALQTQLTAYGLAGFAARLFVV